VEITEFPVCPREGGRSRSAPGTQMSCLPRASLATMRAMRVCEGRALRAKLGLSRPEFARYLGVSDGTIARWESEESTTEPKGLQAVLLSALEDALARHPPGEIARLVRSCGLNHRAALKELLRAADGEGTPIASSPATEPR
jgi:DNA-binding transcriptional regulator YiaG